MQSTLDRIADWMARQPWYSPGEDGIPRLRELVEVFLPSPDPSARVRVLLVRDESPASPVLYQLPLVERDARPGPAAPGLIGTGYGGATLLDGVRDPAFPAALLAGVNEVGRLRDPADDRMIVESDVVAEGTVPVLRLLPYGRPALEARLFRRVLDGPHPDPVAGEALAEAGVTVGPRFVGTLPVRWTEEDGEHVAHLAVLREAAGSGVDGWRVAADAAQRHVDAGMGALGRALALTHEGLLARLGSRQITASERAALLGAWRTRLAAAASEVPAIAELADRVEAVYLRTEGLATWPRVQTVHGALELGLTVRADDGAWALHSVGGADPVPAEDRADLAARDVAGILRSLHYAGGLRRAPVEWTARQRSALLDGYTAVAGGSALPAALLDAIEADFAIVDTVWEARARPDSVAVPLAALRRLTGSRDGGELAA